MFRLNAYIKYLYMCSVNTLTIPFYVDSANINSINY